MNDSKSKASSWEAQTAKNTKSLGFWTIAWVLSLALAVFGPMFIWDSQVLLSVLAVAANLATGVGMILANKQHLHGLDEMQQKIQLEAMALSLGVGLITGLSFSTLAIVDLISFDADISHMVILMSITYAIGLTIGRRKYQ
jgi:uncharacterized membrane protein YhiD involved in acid resistance